jgi:adenosylcobyric acid synthase
MTAVCIMVLGTTSGAGKSWVTTALCRYYARLGLKVAPFKAQNMSNNARVVAGFNGGQGEIGSAQYFQSLAAKVVPDVRMNPVLLKPEADTVSQLVLLGTVNRELSDMPWRDRSEHVWPFIRTSLDQLRAENDVVVIEGAGSPAEINLHESDIVNMRVALYGQANCLLVTDIDRGGAFAHLYGTWALLPQEEQRLIKGFVLNKFRGDASLLAPGPQMLQELTGIPVMATLPMWYQHGLPEEDGVFDDCTYSRGVVTKTIVIIAYPRISNLDEFQTLKNIPGVRLVWARAPRDCVGADWIVLPGSKSTASDLRWVREQGLDVTVSEHAARGGAVLGVCGGLQMLGKELIDPHGVDGNALGLGLLPLVTVFDRDKTVRRTVAKFGTVVGMWAALSNVSVEGYEIHHGQTIERLDAAVQSDELQKDALHHEVALAVLPSLAWQNREGNVIGCYLHGLFEDSAVLQSLFGVNVPTLDDVFDGLANFLQTHVEQDVLNDLIKRNPDAVSTTDNCGA